jgi:peptidyl-prolyl cis-trans isomerase A (cyclophilin A)
VDDVQVTGGTLRDFAGTGRSYSAQFIPEAGRVGDAIISVPSGAFSNASGVFNQDGADANNRVSVVYDASAPRLQWADDVSVVQAPVVAFETSVGSFVIEIDAQNAPLTTSNVLAYVQDGFYEGVIFHRSIPGFMVQGGGFDAGGIYRQPTYDPVPLEADNGLLNVRASVAMARTSDPNSATSQFYVNLVDNAFLDGNYTVFGTVVSGMDTVDVMADIPTGALRPIGAEGQSLSDYPMQDVTILHAEQTMPGRAVSEQAGTVLSLLDLDMLDASTPVPWRYSLDSGATWQPGEGTSLPVPEGQYPLGSIQVRYEAAPGVAGVDTNTLPLELTVDDPLTGRVEVQVYHWQSHQLIEGVTLETPMEVVATRSDGAVSMRGGAGPILDVQASMPTDDPGLRLAAQQAVDLGDAVAIVRMALGAGSGVGGSNGDSLSPYQRLAADVDGDGELSLRDALGALRIASGLPLPSNQSLWRFVDERSLVPTASIETGTGADSEVRVAVDPAAPQSSLRGLVATVVGDVDGSFDLGDSATRLDASYFATLVNEVEGLDLARFGIGG